MIEITPFGDSAVLLSFGKVPNEQMRRNILGYTQAIKHKQIPGVGGLIPAYTSLTVCYDFLQISFEELKSKLQAIDPYGLEKDRGEIVRIPVCYESKFSVDMQEVIEHTGLSREEIIELHTAPIYQVYMLGFVPGFFYLGGLDARLYCPRKETPRLIIPEGSVGMAGNQTGVYPLESPGGWQLLGKTPLKIFDKHSTEKPFYVNQGDRVQFYEISLEEYNQLAG